MKVLREPDTDAALRFLQGELAAHNEGRGHLVQAIADCQVRYQGRATSTLHRGERLLLLKPDGTLLVHTAAKAKPVNWQPPGAAFSVALVDGRVHLTSQRLKPEEIVQVDFHTIHLLLSVPLRDEADLALVGSEDDLQELLFTRPELVEAGFVPQRRERNSARGFYDLDGRDRNGHRLIVEVKRTTAGVSEAQQLWRYVERLRGTEPDCRGILMAPRVAEKARSLLAEQHLEWKELDWTDLMPKVEAMRVSGQSSLVKFG